MRPWPIHHNCKDLGIRPGGLEYHCLLRSQRFFWVCGWGLTPGTGCGAAEISILKLRASGLAGDGACLLEVMGFHKGETAPDSNFINLLLCGRVGRAGGGKKTP